MPTPQYVSFQSQLANTAGQAIPGGIVAVLIGVADAVNLTDQPGSPLATIWADPYGNSQIPQTALSLSGDVTTVAGSPNVAYASGQALSQFLPGLNITINGVQYTVASWDSVDGVTSIVLETNALSSGTFAWSATIPAAGGVVPDGEGNYQFWTLPGFYTLQIYGGPISEPYIQGISLEAPVIGSVGTGNGTSGELVLTTLKGTGGGPANPTVIVGYEQVIYGGATYWRPLFQ